MPNEVVPLNSMTSMPGMPECDRLIGEGVPGYGRLTNRAVLVDAWIAAGHDELTHPQASARIDHCFFSASLGAHIARVWVDDTAMGSDHCPVRTKFA